MILLPSSVFQVSMIHATGVFPEHNEIMIPTVQDGDKNKRRGIKTKKDARKQHDKGKKKMPAMIEIALVGSNILGTTGLLNPKSSEGCSCLQQYLHFDIPRPWEGLPVGSSLQGTQSSVFPKKA